MKFTKTFLYTALSMTCANWANAEVAQSKNDELDKKYSGCGAKASSTCDPAEDK